MKKAHQQDTNALSSTPLRFTKASVMARGHMPAAIKNSRRARRYLGLRRGEQFIGPKSIPPVKVTFVTPPQGTWRQRLTILKGRLVHHMRATLGRFLAR